MADIFAPGKLGDAEKFTADYFSNAVLINNGNWNFTLKPLPWEAQLSACRDAVVVNANNDALPDVLLAGNYYHSNIQMGKYDADNGTVLVNHGKAGFTCENFNGFVIKGEARHILPLHIKNDTSYLIVRNNDSAVVIKFK